MDGDRPRAVLVVFADFLTRVAGIRPVPGDDDREGLATAYVTALWMTKGGVVGQQYHAELIQVLEGESA